MLSYLSVPATAIDLPWTGDIVLEVHKQVPKAPFVVGYSAGGRVALELKERFPKDYGTLILFSTHLGFESELAREKKFQDEQKWIELLSHGSIDEFLEKWYSQDLFQTFRNSEIFKHVLENRRKQDSKKLISFLKNFGTSKKKATSIPTGTILVCGEEDLKYEGLYRKLMQVHRVYTVKNAGHAIHLENPEACAKIVDEVINAAELA